ncbi:YciI family protein [Devosia sp. A16]|uniref:YciI family protein n=1 Tax=Devosia sp. A16 TaxID=1736675 RepID=UPI0006D78C9E|nr:YciI family protein [Devosia sp. A16]
MTQYLVAIHLPDDFEPNSDSVEARRDIADLNLAMQAQNIVVFVGGLGRVSEARSVRRKPDGGLLVTDGPYIESKEHLGGFWVLELPDMDAALDWGKRAAIACRAPVEVRAFGTLEDKN